ncbi:MAG TPA: type IV secretion system DNA-binding domain-containing protein [Candidatus Angelobacter sp.]
MTQWGRKENYRWPNRRPLALITALLVAAAATIGTAVYDYKQQWTFLQQTYLKPYLNSVSHPWVKTMAFTLVYRIDGKKEQLARNEDFTDPAVLAGQAKLKWERSSYLNADMQRWFQEVIYDGQNPFALLFGQAWKVGLSALIVGLVWAIPRDRKRRRVLKYGRPTKGPELVSAAAFNRANHSDGIGLQTKERRTLGEFLLRRDGNLVRIPQDKESSHFMMMGDTGAGKSSLIRQILLQVEQRGETAIVYDPALEYTPQFYNRTRGDVVLNPLDQRMPYWTPCAEVQHEAEAESLAAALFKDDNRSNPFFINVPRQIFAHLLTEDPQRTPHELLAILRDEQELTRRLKGTEYAAAIHPEAAQQRGGMMATLNMVANALKLLPAPGEAQASWTASSWAKQRQGWLFITSPHEFRERLRPLISMWLDMLILRLMNQGKPGVRPVWFILDELQSLHVLPQLHTAITENRKAGNPVVLGFQGRSQVEELYGRKAEVMLSQAAPKIFLRTAEAHSANWISATIGKIEIERLRESRTRSRFPQPRESKTDQSDHTEESLVTDAEIMGLADLRGYLKHGNFVVRLSFDYLDLPQRQPAFLQRKLTPLPAQPAVTADSNELATPISKSNPISARPVQAQANNTADPPKGTRDEEAVSVKPESPKKPYFD